MSDGSKDLFGMPIRVDESIHVSDFHFVHPDGRIDKFSIVENEVLPVHLTKLGDAPNWACPVCSNINSAACRKCELCGVGE